VGVDVILPDGWIAWQGVREGEECSVLWGGVPTEGSSARTQADKRAAVQSVLSLTTTTTQLLPSHTRTPINTTLTPPHTHAQVPHQAVL